MKVFGVTGGEGSGAAGLFRRLAAEIAASGLTVATVSEADATLDIDRPGRDSHRHRMAGAREVIVASSQRWALIRELRGAGVPELEALLARLGPADLVLVEGFASAPHPKIAAYRGAAPVAGLPQAVRAVASDAAQAAWDLPVFDPGDTAAIADFVLRELGHISEPAMPGKLKNDCFALPPGVDWVPVDDALDRLRAVLPTIQEVEMQPVGKAEGLVLARDVTAARAHPPAANSAVDGYGFAAAALGDGPFVLPLVEDRAAAGEPYKGRVPTGAAIRILTGAILPDGVDTVVLQEDVAVSGDRVVFDGIVKHGANTREAGEDVPTGVLALPAGRRLGPQDLALLSALGVAEVAVRRKLRVAVLSTGDELLDDASHPPAGPHQIFDANRPMLLSLAARWRCDTLDLGRSPDEPAEIARRLDRGAREADVILTSGGASAGDEDHVSRLLGERGTLSSWRIAIKPGRPLALALWDGTPVFGLPGNPVAAFVCALIFARPAFSAMEGAGWQAPLGLTVPAGFAKSKKPGRREYLRARLTADGRAEVFASEGSGRISGLSWATGLVELPDGAVEVAPGTPVRYLPFEGFGL